MQQEQQSKVVKNPKDIPCRSSPSVAGAKNSKSSGLMLTFQQRLDD
jgi:hypothetical protein